MTSIMRPSPNFDARAGGTPIDMVVLHYTGMVSAEASLARLCDGRAKVSAHYLIDEEGRLFQLVDEAARAWHAGVASWGGARDVNGRSVGIELQNPGHEHGYRGFPEPQIATLIELLKDVVARHGIPPARVVGHSDVAPMRKQDPGERFPWERLAAAGLAAPRPRVPSDRGPCDVEALRDALAVIGYGVGELGDDAAMRAAITAFHRRFLPQALGQPLDARSLIAARAVATRLTGRGALPYP